MTSLSWLPHYLVPFFSLSYPTDSPKNPDSFPDSSYYNTGPLDACLVLTCILVMAVLRDATRLAVMEPFARWKLTRDLKRAKRQTQQANGKANSVCKNGTANGNGHSVHANGDTPISRKEARVMHRSVLRFAEQSWSQIYYTILWCWGLYIHRNFPTTLLRPTEVWQDYPHIPLATPVKLYYLVQNAFYLHQILILNAEARRKDHIQMMTHHVITVALLVTSYLGNCTRVGCLILVIMDWCDIFLPLAKMFRYLSLSTLCDAIFTGFLVSWFVTRHVLFIIVIKSMYIDCPRLIPFAWNSMEGRYLSLESWTCFVVLLTALQIIQMIWFWMICRVAWRVISGQGANDERSDEENVDENDKKN